MKTAWPTELLGTLCDIQIGRTPTRAQREYWGGEFPWLSISDMNQGRNISSTAERITETAVRALNCRPVQPGTVLLSFKLSIGKVGIATAPLFTNEAIAHLPIIDDRLDRDYLYWALQSIPLTEGADRAAMGATLNKAKLQLLQIPMPPIGEQRRIASILDAADALRAKRRQALEKLDTLTQSIFIDMFSDPITNPKRWSVEPFSSQIFDVRYGTGSPPPYVPDGGVPFIRATDIKGGRIRTNGMKHIAERDATALKKCQVRNGDLIIVRSGVNTGDVAVVPEHLDGACAAYDMIVTLAPHDAHFYHFLLDSEPGRRIVEPLTRRAAQPHLNASQVRDLPLISPPVAERKRFVGRLTEAAALRNQMEKHALQSDALFASLQHRAFRGEL
jgi:type I restriction enzyme S subunit